MCERERDSKRVNVYERERERFEERMCEKRDFGKKVKERENKNTGKR